MERIGHLEKLLNLFSGFRQNWSQKLSFKSISTQALNISVSVSWSFLYNLVSYYVKFDIRKSLHKLSQISIMPEVTGELMGFLNY